MTRSALTLVTTLLAGIPHAVKVAPAQDAHGAGLAGAPIVAAAPARARVLQAARDVMQKARYCTLVTLGEDGHPQARVVDPFPLEGDRDVWIATNPVTRRVAEIRKDARVSLLYFDPSGPGYVTLVGRAEIVEAATEKAKRWKPDWSAFYEDENRGADYVLIRVTAARLELVSHAHDLLNDPRSWRPVSLDLR